MSTSYIFANLFSFFKQSCTLIFILDEEEVCRIAPIEKTPLKRALRAGEKNFSDMGLHWSDVHDKPQVVEKYMSNRKLPSSWMGICTT